MEGILSAIIGALGGILGALLVYHSTVKKIQVESIKVRAESRKLETENDEIEHRITERVLQMAEAELTKLKTDNDKLRMENADFLKMMRAMRMITVKLVRKMEEAGIDPGLTEDEKEALYDTGKLARFSRRHE